MRPRPNALFLQAQAIAWNEKHPEGTPVTVRQDNGEILETKTRSAAWVLGGHSAVVMVDGIAGGYSLDRVRAREENAQPAEAGTPNGEGQA